ncbi:MAG TPA: methyl-accepting chemotaxis protein, partial [Oligoflexia bacterium]|nr:methyl-accepting chemotaxis protein [Oligoflexia bacterium]
SDKQGTVLARGHSEKLGDSVASQVNVTQALSGQAFSGIEAGTVVDFSLRSSFPIKSGSDILGAVTAGIDFAHNEFLDRLKQKTGADATIFKDDTRIATTIIKEGKRATGTRMDNPKVIETVLRRGEVFSAPNVILGRNYITTYWPIRHAKGHVAGMFFVGMPVSSAGVELIKTVIIGTILIVGFAAIISFVFARSVSKRLSVLSYQAAEIKTGAEQQTKTAQQVAAGDLTATLACAAAKRAQTVKESSDEVGQLASVFQGTLQAQDALSAAFSSMLESLKNVLLEIDSATSQVETGTAEISDATQSLSDGAARQASSLEEVTSAMTELAGQTNQNAQIAAEVDQLATDAAQAASAGAERMRDMQKAMDEINASSKDVVRVIKVIDDIAFQTNLLALNAAVEAARAGRHGKGFAVVAEEVRNLAQRSAKAAKETSEQIEASLRRVEHGRQVSEMTVEGLNQIAAKIESVSALMNKLSASVQEQSRGFQEIAQGLKQVDDVTQQNTASTEETASAVAELSDLTRSLKQNVAKFRLA